MPYICFTRLNVLPAGEECDPGTSSSNCCDVATCKLLSGALCDPSNSSCCTSSCGYSESSTVCRPSVNSQCDPAEYCTGNTATCPTDTHTADGTTCGSSGQGLSCAAGQCTSRDLQCEQQVRPWTNSVAISYLAFRTGIEPQFNESMCRSNRQLVPNQLR